MAINYHNIKKDIDAYIASNITSIDAGWSASNIDWNGVDFDATPVDEFIQPFVYLGEADQDEITGDDSGVYVNGFIRFNIFNETGNAYRGYEIGSKLGLLFNKKRLSNNAFIEYAIGQANNVGESVEFKEFFETVWIINFRAKAT